MSISRCRWALAMAMLLALALDLLFYTGYYASDDATYLSAAYTLATGHLELQRTGTAMFEAVGGPSFNYGGLRLALTVPLALIYKLSGGSLPWLCGFSVACHLAIVALTFELGRTIHDQAVGLLGALLVATSPLFYVFSGAVLPDASMVMWTLASITLLFALAHDRDRASSRGLSWFAAGVLLGLGYGSKITAIIAVVPSALLIATSSPRVLSREVTFRIICYSSGMLSYFAAESLALSLLLDEFTTRYGLVSAMSELRPSPPFALEERLVEAYEKLSFRLAAGPLWLFLLSVLAYPFLRGASRRLWFVFAWVVAYLLFGSTSFSVYSPAGIQPRYFAIIVPFGSILVAFVVVAGLKKWAAVLRRPAERSVTIGSATLAALALLANVNETLDDAGEIYGAKHVGTFQAGRRKAAADHPGLALAMDDFYTTRMQGLLVEAAYREGTPWRQYRTRHYDLEPPFLYLASRPVAKGEAARRAEADQRVGLGMRVVAITESRSRADALLHDWHSFFDPTERSTTGLRRSYLYLVEAAEAGDGTYSSHEQVVPLFVRSGHRRISIVHARDGQRVSWPAADYEDHLVRINGFDGEPRDRIPIEDFTEISETGGPRKLLVEMRLIAGGDVDVELHLWLYDQAGEVVFTSSTSAQLSQQNRRIDMAVNAAYNRDATQFRFGFDLRPGRGEPGELVLEEVSLR